MNTTTIDAMVQRAKRARDDAVAAAHTTFLARIEAIEWLAAQPRKLECIDVQDIDTSAPAAPAQPESSPVGDKPTKPLREARQTEPVRSGPQNIPAVQAAKPEVAAPQAVENTPEHSASPRDDRPRPSAPQLVIEYVRANPGKIAQEVARAVAPHVQSESPDKVQVTAVCVSKMVKDGRLVRDKAYGIWLPGTAPTPTLPPDPVKPREPVIDPAKIPGVTADEKFHSLVKACVNTPPMGKAQPMRKKHYRCRACRKEWGRDQTRHNVGCHCDAASELIHQ